MSEEPAISVDRRPDAVVIQVMARDLSEANITAVRQGIAQAVAEAPSLPFIIDMASVKFVPSLTLGALVRMAGEFRARNQRLILVSLQPTVRQVIAITRLDRVLEVMDEVKTALGSVGAGG